MTTGEHRIILGCEKTGRGLEGYTGRAGWVAQFRPHRRHRWLTISGPHHDADQAKKAIEDHINRMSVIGGES